MSKQGIPIIEYVCLVNDVTIEWNLFIKVQIKWDYDINNGFEKYISGIT